MNAAKLRAGKVQIWKHFFDIILTLNATFSHFSAIVSKQKMSIAVLTFSSADYLQIVSQL